MRNKTIIRLIILVLLTLFLSGCSINFEELELNTSEFQTVSEEGRVIRAKILEITNVSEETVEMFDNTEVVKTIEFDAKITSGDFSGRTIKGRQIIDTAIGFRYLPVEKNDKIFLFPTYDEFEEPIGEFAEYARTSQMIWMAVIFAAVLMVFSRFKGFRSLIALIITCAVVFLMFIPMVLKGISPVLTALLACIIITVSTLLIVCKLTPKAWASIIGCITGIIIAGSFASITQGIMKLSGVAEEHSVMLFIQHGLDMNGLLFAAIIIGALGATMDVAVSIASSLEELITTSDSRLSRKSLIKSGMNIGGDIMGTMTNTLILAYVGSSLPLILLLALNSAQLGYAISWEMISTEVLRALAGSIGLICVVPATALATAFIYRKRIDADKPVMRHARR